MYIFPALICNGHQIGLLAQTPPFSFTKFLFAWQSVWNVMFLISFSVSLHSCWHWSLTSRPMATPLSLIYKYFSEFSPCFGWCCLTAELRHWTELLQEDTTLVYLTLLKYHLTSNFEDVFLHKCFHFWLHEKHCFHLPLSYFHGITGGYTGNYRLQKVYSLALLHRRIYYVF